VVAAVVGVVVAVAAVAVAAVAVAVVALIVVDWEGYIERYEVEFVERCAMRYMNARLDVLQHSSPHHEESVVPYFRRSCLEKPQQFMSTDRFAKIVPRLMLDYVKFNLTRG
jgi:hypothetical protein